MNQTVINEILKNKIIAIIRGIYGEDCRNLAQALYQGGIRLMEVTFDQAKEHTYADTQQAIRMIREQMNGKVLVGAGTVTSVELVELACQAGAQYIISPNTDVTVIRRTKELGLVSIPGALTPSEAQTAHMAGADFVKLFPTSQLGAGYIKAVRGPLNHIRLLAVGGVDQHNASSFLRAGAVGVGVGGNLANREWVQAGRFDDITNLAREYVEAVQSGGQA